MESRRPGVLCSTRFNLALICFLGCVIVYACRSNLSFALVCMVNSTAIDDGVQTKISACGRIAQTNTVDKIEGEFAWSKSTQGALLSAFFWGYTSSQILGGQLATIIGGRYVVGAAAIVNVIATLASVAAARTNIMFFIGLRAVLGACQGAMFPAMQQMWSVWAPPMERSLLTGVSFAGAQVGNVMVMPLSGILCKYGPFGGWPSIFYVLGLAGLVWAVLWFYCVADSPKTHRQITDEEREYIVDSLAENNGHESEIKRSVPWKSVLTSMPVWACFVGHFAGDWGAYMMATSLPLYMNDVLGYDLTSMGFISSIPYILYFVCINLGGIMADSLRNSGRLSTVNTRRLAQLFALGSQAIFLLLIGTANCGQETLVIIYLTLGIGLSGLQYAGVVVNYLDIAPSFVGPIFGLGNTISCAAGILSPLVMGWLTPTGAKEEWQMVFMVTAAILAVGGLFYALFADGEVQDWARSDNKTRILQEPLLIENGIDEKNGKVPLS
ncbi:unnamed protein product [Bursaphelenchus okinawaensis]|uniref:Major facilitator superfamily (MFS) profile domain-containing protein n=1 Tax=Bursaphelenchus okinawaensis TaxID=465554 RepID=A0A811KQ79_9BILA|nr:unnamed protein product [Bursaphelenchus okinawaensis]CAG9107847.1 unnamed protein product [Bursaphelenchus okinawaensis]